MIEYERRMRNWALWRVGGAKAFARTFSPIYDMGPRPPRSGNVMPVLAGEAEDTDAAVRSLDVVLQRAVVLWYVRQLSPDNMRRALRCRRDAVAERLATAREQITAFLEDRARVHRARRQALAGRHAGLTLPYDMRAEKS